MLNNIPLSASPLFSALTWIQWAFLFYANDPGTGKNSRIFPVGEQREGILPEKVHAQVEQEQQQEEEDGEEGDGENVVSESESSDSDDGFTNVLDPLSRQAKELIANNCQVLLLATSRSSACFLRMGVLQRFCEPCRLRHLMRPASSHRKKKSQMGP